MYPRTVLLIVVVLGSACASHRNEGWICGTGEPVFECGTESPAVRTPEVVILPFENRTGLARAEEAVEREVTDQIRAAGFTVASLDSIPHYTIQDGEEVSAATTGLPDGTLFVRGLVLAQASRGDVHGLRGAVRIYGGNVDTRWFWEARVTRPGPPPIEELARRVSVKGHIQR